MLGRRDHTFAFSDSTAPLACFSRAAVEMVTPRGFHYTVKSAPVQLVHHMAGTPAREVKKEWLE